MENNVSISPMHKTEIFSPKLGFFFCSV